MTGPNAAAETAVTKGVRVRRAVAPVAGNDRPTNAAPGREVRMAAMRARGAAVAERARSADNAPGAGTGRNNAATTRVHLTAEPVDVVKSALSGRNGAAMHAPATVRADARATTAAQGHGARKAPARNGGPVAVQPPGATGRRAAVMGHAARGGRHAAAPAAMIVRTGHSAHP